jgi:DHA1 family bicyclomycin/chloramphenicol resistance-like MFS transporter
VRDPAVGRIRPRSGAFLTLLIGLGCFGPLSMSIYTPIMPAIGSGLNAGPDEVKLTLTTYMVGFAVGQIFFGPLSDRFGRRPVLLAGLAMFTLMSVACALATSVHYLIGLRLLQGLGACAGVVISRALARDAYDFNEMPKIMSWVALGVQVAPAVAPAIGGHLAVWFGWTSAFWFLAGFAGLMLVVVAFGLGETNKHRAVGFSILGFARGSAEMLRHRLFLGYALTLGFAFSIIFGTMVGLPFILQDHIGVPPDLYGYCIILSVLGFTGGTFANNRLIGRIAPERIVGSAAWCHLTGLGITGVLALFGILTVWSVMLPYMLVSFGTGIITPLGNARAVGLFPQLAGTASSLIGLSQMGMGAIGTILVAVATSIGGHDRPLPLLGEWVGCTTAACAVPMPMLLALLPSAVGVILCARLLRRPVRQ